MTTDLALRNADPIALGEVMFASKMFPDAKSAVQATVKILAGQEYGLGAVASMSGIHVIDNKPVPGAHVLAGLVKRGPRYDYIVHAHDNTRCVLDFFDTQGRPVERTKDNTAIYLRLTAAPGRYLGESEFKFEDAKRAGLSGRTNWQRYPRNMLFARALANGVRWYCPDVTQTGQVLVAEEAADLADVDYAPPGATPEPVKVENVAADWQPSEAQIVELRTLYASAGWAEDEDHSRMRMALAAVGAGNSGSLGECLARLTEDQFAQVREALIVAATATTFDATEETA